MNKILATVCICIFLGSILTTGLSGKTEAAGLAPLVYSFDEPIIEKVLLNDELYDKVTMEGGTSTQYVSSFSARTCPWCDLWPTIKPMFSVTHHLPLSVAWWGACGAPRHASPFPLLSLLSP